MHCHDIVGKGFLCFFGHLLDGILDLVDCVVLNHDVSHLETSKSIWFHAFNDFLNHVVIWDKFLNDMSSTIL